MFVKLAKHIRNGNTLTVLEPLPFTPKRVFYTALDTNDIRGKHAHKVCRELIIPVSGVIKIEVTTMEHWDTHILSYKDGMGFLLEPYMWREISLLSESGGYYVLASEGYNPKDYLNTPEEFREYYGKKSN